MAKKVIDIFPPKKKTAIEEKKEEKEIEAKPKKKSHISFRPIVKKMPALPFKKGMILSFVFLVLLAIFCYVTLSKAEINVWPETENLNLIEKADIDANAAKVDSVLKIIPAQNLQKEKTVVQTFPASGKISKEEKAQGTVKVYNAFSTSPQVLVATTRFVSADGKVFRTPVKITIPGGTYDKGKLIPGSVDIKIVADQPGESYNIGPTTFSIPGFAGTDKYTKFYGESSEAMSGGYQSEVSKVTEEDLAKAEETIIDKAKKECNDLLQEELKKNQTASVLDYIPDSVQSEIIEKFSAVSANQEAQEFSFQAKAQCRTLVFKKEDINNYVREAIAFQIPQDKKLYEESLKINYNVDEVNLETGQIEVSITITAKIYADLDVISFKNALKGKSLLEAKLFLENYPKVLKASVKFWPFWVNKVPDELSKIKFNLIIE